MDDQVERPKSFQRYGEYVRSKIAEWLDSKLPGSAICPVCSANEWTVEVPAEIFVRGTTLSGRAYPVLPLTCRNCGYTLLFNTKVVGILDEREFLAEQERTEETEGAE